MSDQSRGRPVLKRIELDDLDPDVQPELKDLVRDGELWCFCGEYDGSAIGAVDHASGQRGEGIYKVFPSGSWAGGYLRD